MPLFHKLLTNPEDGCHNITKAAHPRFNIKIQKVPPSLQSSVNCQGDKATVGKITAGA